MLFLYYLLLKSFIDGCNKMGKYYSKEHGDPSFLGSNSRPVHQEKLSQNSKLLITPTLTPKNEKERISLYQDLDRLSDTYLVNRMQEEKNSDKSNPFHVAAYHKNVSFFIACCKRLLKIYPDEVHKTFMQENDLAQTPLVTASYMGHIEIVACITKLIPTSPADLKNALYWASKFNKKNVVEYLDNF
ncbi:MULTISPECIES: ankyrin repeat domain-containing protein [Candidatus Cardinium]|uniref:ankyrin repeat domain-containing protein n=1 Tax=Candidatus Cardinium TaxID=273135 RepID=UPI001FAB07D0|nr:MULTISPECIES: ankyrin repeat domain-containing protein [Cardinium]